MRIWERQTEIRLLELNVQEMNLEQNFSTSDQSLDHRESRLLLNLNAGMENIVAELRNMRTSLEIQANAIEKLFEEISDLRKHICDQSREDYILHNDQARTRWRPTHSHGAVQPADESTDSGSTLAELYNSVLNTTQSSIVVSDKQEVIAEEDSLTQVNELYNNDFKDETDFVEKGVNVEKDYIEKEVKAEVRAKVNKEVKAEERAEDKNEIKAEESDHGKKGIKVEKDFNEKEVKAEERNQNRNEVKAKERAQDKKEVRAKERDQNKKEFKAKERAIDKNEFKAEERDHVKKEVKVEKGYIEKEVEAQERAEDKKEVKAEERTQDEKEVKAEEMTQDEKEVKVEGRAHDKKVNSEEIVKPGAQDKAGSKGIFFTAEKRNNPHMLDVVEGRHVAEGAEKHSIIQNPSDSSDGQDDLD